MDPSVPRHRAQPQRGHRLTIGLEAGSSAAVTSALYSFPSQCAHLLNRKLHLP